MFNVGVERSGGSRVWSLIEQAIARRIVHISLARHSCKRDDSTAGWSQKSCRSGCHGPTVDPATEGGTHVLLSAAQATSHGLIQPLPVCVLVFFRTAHHDLLTARLPIASRETARW